MHCMRRAANGTSQGSSSCSRRRPRCPRDERRYRHGGGGGRRVGAQAAGAPASAAPQTAAPLPAGSACARGLRPRTAAAATGSPRHPVYPRPPACGGGVCPGEWLLGAAVEHSSRAQAAMAGLRPIRGRCTLRIDPSLSVPPCLTESQLPAHYSVGWHAGGGAGHGSSGAATGVSAPPSPRPPALPAAGCVAVAAAAAAPLSPPSASYLGVGMAA